MTDHTLKGNNDGPCPACGGRGWFKTHDTLVNPTCRACRGTGLAPLPDAEIIRRTLAEREARQ